MRTCVTGGAGFIGSHLVDRLVADGHEVVVLDDLSSGRRENLAAVWGRIELRVGDVREPADLAAAFAGCRVIYHQAALASVEQSVRDPVRVHEVNVTGTVRTLEAARAAGADRVVFASSSSVYGSGGELPRRETQPTRPCSPYAATKAAGEACLHAWHRAYGLETVALRYFNAYGPRQPVDSAYAAVVPSFVEAMAAGRPPVLHGDGEQTRDFVYVEDLVDAIVRAGDADDVAGRAINLAGGSRVTIRALADIVAEALGFEGEPRHAPPRVGDVRHALADITLARHLLGWMPRTPLAEGIARTVAAQEAAPGGDQTSRSSGSTSGP